MAVIRSLWAILKNEKQTEMSEIRINSIKVKNYRSFGEEQEFTEYPETFLPTKLREFLELDKLVTPTADEVVTENSEVETDGLTFCKQNDF